MAILQSIYSLIVKPIPEVRICAVNYSFRNFIGLKINQPRIKIYRALKNYTGTKVNKGNG
jgi:hypothetical protein